MAVISTITISAVVYSVYALTSDPVQDADDYLATKIGSTWSTATTLEKQQCIISAARLLDRAVAWSGAQTVAGQARQWPRDGASNSCTGSSVTSGTTPDEIALAEFELADLLFLDNDLLNSQGTGSNIKRVKAGEAEVEFGGSTINTSLDSRLPTPVNDIAHCFIAGTTTRGGSYGTTEDDSDPGYRRDDYDRSRGYS